MTNVSFVGKHFDSRTILKRLKQSCSIHRCCI